jgi:tetratricopeptide (TPR) repeat protein
MKKCPLSTRNKLSKLLRFQEVSPSQLARFLLQLANVGLERISSPSDAVSLFESNRLVGLKDEKVRDPNWRLSLQEQPSNVPSSYTAALVLSVTCIAIACGLLFYLTPLTVQTLFGLDKPISQQAPPIEGYSEIVDPKTSDAFCNRGMSRAQVGDIKGALKDFDEAIRLGPKNGRAYYGRAQVYVDQEKHAQAVADYNLAVKYEPNESKYWLARGRGISTNGGTREDVLACYDRGIELDPENPELYCARAYIRGLMLDTKGAIADLNQAEKYDKKDAYIPYARGNEQLVLKNQKAAMEDFNKALAMYPEYSTVLCTRGRLYKDMGDMKSAMRDFDRAIKVAPDDPWPYEVRSMEKMAIGDKAGAAEDKKQHDILEAKQKAKEKKVKKKRYEFITNPIVYKFANDTLASAQKVFGPAKVPIKRLYIMYRSGNSCQTVMVDEKRGVFCICMANDETTDAYFHSLGHELIHCLNTRLADPYIEGICSYIGANSNPPPRRQFRAWARQYDRGVVKLKFYRETYVMVKELVDKLGMNGIRSILSYVRWDGDSKFWQQVDVDAWLKSLPDDKRIIARDIINKYADQIQKVLPDDGAYSFARPSDRGSYAKKWLHQESSDSMAHRPNPKLLLPHEPGYVKPAAFQQESNEDSESEDKSEFETNTKPKQEPGKPSSDKTDTQQSTEERPIPEPVPAKD